MSQRTIVEFNHDYAHKIDDDPSGFTHFLRYALRSGTGEHWEQLERFGVRRAIQAHHSDDRKAIVNGREHLFP